MLCDVQKHHHARKRQWSDVIHVRGLLLDTENGFNFLIRVTCVLPSTTATTTTRIGCAAELVLDGVGSLMGRQNRELQNKFGRHAAIWYEIFQKGDRGALVLKEGCVTYHHHPYPHCEHQCPPNGITLLGGFSTAPHNKRRTGQHDDPSFWELSVLPSHQTSKAISHAQPTIAHNYQCAGGSNPGGGGGWHQAARMHETMEATL